MNIRKLGRIVVLVSLALALPTLGHAQDSEDKLPPEISAFIVKADQPDTESEKTADTNDTTQPDAAQTDTTTATAETKPSTPKLTAEQKAFQDLLDKQLLGIWSLLVVEKGQTVTDKALNDAAIFCLRKPRLRTVRFQEGAEKVLPDTKLLFGNIVWYRSPKGLQRADLLSNKVALVNSVTKGRKTKTGEVWTLKNDIGAMRIVFGEAKQKNRNVIVMFEENSLFLKCPVNLPQP